MYKVIQIRSKLSVSQSDTDDVIGNTTCKWLYNRVDWHGCSEYLIQNRPARVNNPDTDSENISNVFLEAANVNISKNNIIRLKNYVLW